MPDHPTLTIVAPFFNEVEGIVAFSTQVRAVLDSMDLTYEVILVDDGSNDGSSGAATSLDWPQRTVLRLAANSGHQAALDAGLRHSSGDFVVTMDSDLQHPPEVVPALLNTIRSQGVDVVYAVRSDRREEGWFKRWSAHWYYRLVRALTRVPIIEDAADFRIMSRFVVDVLNAIPDKKVFRLILPSLGFSFTTVPYKANLRFAGSSKYSLRHMTRLAIRSSVDFSPHPLRIVAVIGLLTSVLAVAWLIFVFVSFLTGSALIGWPSLMAVVLIFGGLTLFSLGVIGEYVGELYEIAKGRPRYVVRAIENHDDGPQA